MPPEVIETEIAAPTVLPPAAVSNPGLSEVTETPGGHQVSVDMAAPTAAQLSAPTQAQSSWLKSVPESYQKEPWVADLAKQDDPTSAFFKEFANQRSLVGRRSDGLQVPPADAPPEKWQEFNDTVRKAQGVPEKAEDYTYQAPKAPEGLETFYQTDEKLLGAMKQAAHKAGVSPQGWKEITAAFDGYYAGALQESVAAVDAQLKATESTFKQHYGDKTPQVLANLDKSFSAAPDWAKPILSSLQPATKAAMASLLFNFQTKYVSEDRLDMRTLNAPATMNQTEYGNAFEKAFAKVHETRHNPGGAEHMKAKADLATLRAMGTEIFKAG